MNVFTSFLPLKALWRNMQNCRFPALINALHSPNNPCNSDSSILRRPSFAPCNTVADFWGFGRLPMGDFPPNIDGLFWSISMDISLIKGWVPSSWATGDMKSETGDLKAVWCKIFSAVAKGSRATIQRPAPTLRCFGVHIAAARMEMEHSPDMAMGQY